MPDASQWTLTQERIQKTNAMVLEFLEGLEPDLRFRMPQEGVTHIAWQVGHLTWANYGIGLVRIRGTRAEDAALLPESYQKAFGRGSVPSTDRAGYPSQERLLEIFNQVNTQIEKEMQTYTLEQLAEPSEPAHPLFPTKFDALVFLPYHVMMHFGQMGLLRRLAGKEPLR